MKIPEQCIGCGRCCQSYSVIPIQPDDKVPDDMLAHDEESGQLGMKRLGGACIAFDHVRKICTIYEIRPGACREVQRGDCMCMTALEDTSV